MWAKAQVLLAHTRTRTERSFNRSHGICSSAPKNCSSEPLRVSARLTDDILGPGPDLSTVQQVPFCCAAIGFGAPLLLVRSWLPRWQRRTNAWRRTTSPGLWEARLKAASVLVAAHEKEKVTMKRLLLTTALVMAV